MADRIVRLRALGAFYVLSTLAACGLVDGQYSFTNTGDRQVDSQSQSGSSGSDRY